MLYDNIWPPILKKSYVVSLKLDLTSDNILGDNLYIGN